MNKLISLLLCFCLALSCMPLSSAAEPAKNTFSASSPARSSASGPDGISTDTFIITLKDNTLAEGLEAEGVQISYSDKDFVILDFTGTTAELSNYLDHINTLDCVAGIEHDAEISLLAITNDYFSDTMYWMDNTGSYTKYSYGEPETIPSASGIDIDGPEGWAEYESSSPTRSVTVAVIDTGIDYTHPELADAMWVNPGEIPDNNIDDDGNGFVDDIYGWDFFNDDASICHYEYNEYYDAYLSSSSDSDNHGTHCAGIIAAARNNSIGIAGVASVGDVKLMSLKVYGGSDYSGSIANCIKAIRYAESMGAQICNISWGYYSYSSSLYTAIERSHMLFVCAAGNYGTDNDSVPLYPASYDLSNIISVAFLDANGELTDKSSYGALSVDVAVPATDIFSTTVGTYYSMSGSSMAAPQVTGIAALLYTYGEGMFPSNVREIIMNSVTPVASCEGKILTGGIPSLFKALQLRDGIIYDNLAPELSVTMDYSDGSIILRFNARDEGGSGICNLRYFTGKRSDTYFAKGTVGTAITDNTLSLSKPGYYTFYLCDYAGNEITRQLRVADDVIAPTINNVGISVNNKMTKITVTAYVFDNQSGIRNVKYLKGCHKASDFVSSSVESLTPNENGRVKFSVTEAGTYTLYVSDMRGNATVTYIYAYIRKATGIELSRNSKTLSEGKTWSLKASLTPSNSTDKITYKSSDENIATVNASGTITALAPGECTITVKTSSGKAAECRIKVKAKAVR